MSSLQLPVSVTTLIKSKQFKCQLSHKNSLNIFFVVYKRR